MPTVNIYLTFDGNCEEAFNFYKSVFGGEFPYIGRFGEMPPDEAHPVDPKDANKIMHVSLPISKETFLMGSDTGGEWSPNFKVGNNFAISVNADAVEETEKIFNALAAGGNVTMPIGKTFWSSSYGMLTDKFGINWMVSINEPMPG